MIKDFVRTMGTAPFQTLNVTALTSGKETDAKQVCMHACCINATSHVHVQLCVIPVSARMEAHVCTPISTAHAQEDGLERLVKQVCLQ